ncbi:MAG: hypothetical protein ACP5GH_07345 [Nitrososphaeria archaeon]
MRCRLTIHKQLHEGQEQGIQGRLQAEEGEALEVQRSYGSHTLFDIRAVFPNRVLIQVKKDRIGKDELRG